MFPKVVTADKANPQAGTTFEGMDLFFRGALRSALLQSASGDLPDPRVVVLSPGSASETAYDQAFIASALGFPLVQGSDLVVRDGAAKQAMAFLSEMFASRGVAPPQPRAAPAPRRCSPKWAGRPWGGQAPNAGQGLKFLELFASLGAASRGWRCQSACAGEAHAPASPAAKGSPPDNAWYIVTARLHRSVCGVTFTPSANCSGDMKWGVPIIIASPVVPVCSMVSTCAHVIIFHDKNRSSG